MALVELSGVRKSYGKGSGKSDVLGGVDLRIDEGEFVAVVGYSGSGKTTLVSLIAGLIAADAGSVTVLGKAVTGPGRDRGVVFQNYSLLPWLSAFENVLLAVEQAFPDASQDERRARVDRYLELVGLGAAKAKRPSELSGGMRQRVAVARALAMDPAVLLMDEPLGALDALTRATLQTEIARIWRADKKTVLLITNDVDEGIVLADRIVPLSGGPAATLGPSVRVDIERPRDRRALNHDARFKAIRAEVIEWLLAHAPRKRVPREPDKNPAHLATPSLAGAR
ncbi:MAG TPA: ABC transporter ATP-binding protein [Polyangiaceae bacterium]